MKKALWHLHLAVFLAGFTAILGNLITLNEVLLVLFRVAIAVPVMFLINRYMQSADVSNSDKIRSMLIGCVIAFHWIAFYASIKYANVSVALVCFAATGFFTALFEPMVERKRINSVEVFLGLLAVAGIYIIFDFYPQYHTGIVFGVLAAVGSALFPLMNKRMLKRVEPGQLTFYNLSGCLIFTTLIAPVYIHFFPKGNYIPNLWDVIWLVILAVGCTILPFLLQLDALKKISAFTVNLTYNLEPFYGIAMAFVFFGEHKEIGVRFFIGMGLVLLSLIWQMLRVYASHRK